MVRPDLGYVRLDVSWLLCENYWGPLEVCRLSWWQKVVWGKGYLRKACLVTFPYKRNDELCFAASKVYLPKVHMVLLFAGSLSTMYRHEEKLHLRRTMLAYSIILAWQSTIPAQHNHHVRRPHEIVIARFACTSFNHDKRKTSPGGARAGPVQSPDVC